MMPRRMRNVLAAVAAVVVLASCSVFAPPAAPTNPQSYQQSVAYGYAQLAGAYGLLGDLVERRRISLPEAQATLKQLDELRAAMDAASAINDVQRLQSVTQGLIAIETTLKQKAQQQ